MSKQELVAQLMPISQLQISKFNVRKEHDDTDKITELAKSIQEQGILHPLLVRPENGKYGIVIGSRRYSAAKRLHLKELPVTIKHLGDHEALIVSVIENLQRNDLEPKETSKALTELNETMTDRELAAKIGKTHRYVQDMVMVGELLARLDDAGTKVQMYPSDEDKQRKKGIALYHTIFVAQAFRHLDLTRIFGEADEDKSLDKQVEVAKAVINIGQRQVEKVLKRFRRYPEDDINFIVEQVLMGVDDEERTDYKGERGEKGIDIAKYEAAINKHTARLCFRLSNISKMPEPTDDVEVDYIRKSREFRKMFVSELDSMHRAGIHSRLNYLSGLIEEMMDEIEKVHKKK
jgi:ParB/RepB/Spo0J family partition protein